jgi:hypothetical protein
MERGLRVASDWMGERSEGLKSKENVPHVWGIRRHSQFRDIWCRHYKDSSWQKINEDRTVRKRERE